MTDTFYCSRDKRLSATVHSDGAWELFVNRDTYAYTTKPHRTFNPAKGEMSRDAKKVIAANVFDLYRAGKLRRGNVNGQG